MSTNRWSPLSVTGFDMTPSVIFARFLSRSPSLDVTRIIQGHYCAGSSPHTPLRTRAFSLYRAKNPAASSREQKSQTNYGTVSYPTHCLPIYVEHSTTTRDTCAAWMMHTFLLYCWCTLGPVRQLLNRTTRADMGVLRVYTTFSGKQVMNDSAPFPLFQQPILS